MTIPAETPDASEKEPSTRRRRWPRVVALAVSLVVLGGAGVAWGFYQHLDGNIRTDIGTANELEQYQADRPPVLVTEAENILLIGSDTRGDGNGAYGVDEGTQRSDTTILLHLASDRSSSTAVSIPRDLMADIPSCTRPDGTKTEEQFAQFNWAYEFGGAACTIRTVEKLTGVRVDDHLIVDFTGFTRIVDAVGGVDVCVPHDVHDVNAKLDLRAGFQTLTGKQSLGYVRTRSGIGDGSDTQRMSRQQAFLGSLVKKVRDNGTLLNPAELYPLLDAATSSLTASAGLDSLTELYELSLGLEKTPTDRIRFLTVPRQAYRYDTNRDELVQPEAEVLFEAIRNDRVVNVATPDPQDTGGQEAGTTTPTQSPTYDGIVADQNICTVDE